MGVFAEAEAGTEGELEAGPLAGADEHLLFADVGPVTLQAQLGALLFVSPRPLTTDQLAELAESTPEEVELALEALQQELSASLFGFGLFEVGGAFQLRTSPVHSSVVQRLIPQRARRLTRAAAETLAVIAYKQPVQRSEIESIRGVDALPTLRTLLDARLIRIVGRESTPGQPALYGTTTTFLEKFGLKDLAELPTVRELVELAHEPGEIDAGDALEEENYETESDSEGAFGLDNTPEQDAENEA